MNKVEALNLMEDMMRQHGLYDWKAVITDNRSRLGYCHWTKKTIGLSIYHATGSTDGAIMNTILHEIAHALVGPSNDPHGPKWQRKALEIGCNAERCGYMNAPKKFTGHCPSCNKVFKVNRRTNIACSDCCRIHNRGRYTPVFKIVW
jgi:predicted SprT family Zn-dependent metalloprotease